jgi:hypothetical protein
LIALSGCKKRSEEYRFGKNDMYETIEDFDDMQNLGHGFLSSDPLEDGEKEYIIA